MANTYSQISIHAVFAVKGRENFIMAPWRGQLHRYLSGIITANGATALAVGGWKDHVHIFFGMPVHLSISDFMRIVKANSSKWIKSLLKRGSSGSRAMGLFPIPEAKEME